MPDSIIPANSTMPRSLLAIASLVPSMALAQLSDTTSLPRDLIAALHGGYMGEPEYVVGRAPNIALEHLVPANTVVLGGVVRRRQRTSAIEGASIALVMSGSPDETRTGLIDLFMQRGFKESPAFMGPREGFASTYEAMPEYRVFCRDSSELSLTTRNRAQGGSYAIISLTRSREHSACGRIGAASLRTYDRPEDLRFPVLNPPDDATGRQTMSTGWRSDSREGMIGANLVTELSTDGVLEHYTKEFERGGWTRGERVAGGPVLVQILRSASVRGQRHVILTNYRTPDGTHHVAAQLFVIPAGSDR